MAKDRETAPNDQKLCGDSSLRSFLGSVCKIMCKRKIMGTLVNALFSMFVVLHYFGRLMNK